jgi:hypothetical protein
MDERSIRVGIKSRRARMQYEKERAIRAIERDDYAVAALAVACAMLHKGAIDELETQATLEGVEL